MKKITLLILFTCSALIGQNKDSLKNAADTSQYYYYTPPKDTIIYKERGKYFHFLSLQDSSTQARLITAGINYKCTVQSSTFKLNGAYLSIGLNLGRLFSKKIVFGPFVDFRPFNGGLNRQYFSPSFISDLNSNFNPSYNSQQDSAFAYVFREAVNQRSFYGNTFSYIGVMLSLFPQKYGGILLSAKRGAGSYRIAGLLGNAFINNGETDEVYLNIPQNYCFELTIKPYALFKNSFIRTGKGKGGASIFKFMTCSFFYEYLNLKSANIEGYKLSSMVNSSFMNKYGTVQCYGFSVGLSFY